MEREIDETSFSAEIKNHFMHLYPDEREGDIGSELVNVLRKIDEEFSDFCGELAPNEKFTETEKRIIDIITSIRAEMFPITVIYEPYYVDAVYRDEYSRFYSRKYFNFSRNTKRLILIKGVYEENYFYGDESSEKLKSLEQDLIGMLVLKPTKSLGRVLLNPAFLDIPHCYIRTTDFEISVGGRRCSFKAFPLSGQDAVMTCAETNVWQIMEYFGQRYKDYKTLMPGEIRDLLKDHFNEREFPADGLTPEEESHIFTKAGLGSIIYNRWFEDYNGNIKEYTWCGGRLSFYDILHFYIEGGIPVLLNLEDVNNPDGEGHAVTCIGHVYKDIDERIKEEIKKEHKNRCCIKKMIDKLSVKSHNELLICPSWSESEKYIVMEDHSVPYRAARLDDLVFGNSADAIHWRVESFVVPLHKNVFMKAEEAYEFMQEYIAGNLDKISLCTDGETDKNNGPKVILIRFFLCSSRSFKDFRIRNIKSDSEELSYSEWLFYNNVEYPKFLWVAEYAVPSVYKDHRANGEIILDATSSDSPFISVRFGSSVRYRSPDEPRICIDSLREDIKLPETFAIYESKNLEKYGISRMHFADT